MFNRMKYAAIYGRVSTDRQEEQRTIESQISELREVCRKDGISVVKEYTDDGFSGTTLIRPGLEQLRDDASRGVFQAVYVLSPDRLARKYVYQALVIEELRKRNIDVIFLNKPVTDKPEDQLLLGIQGLIAEYERAQILERSRRGRMYRVRNGELMGGLAALGYDYVPKSKHGPAHYQVNEGEAATVRLIFSLYLELGSTTNVTKELIRRKVKTRRGSHHWKKSTVHRILTNESYIGTAYYNKFQALGKGLRKRDRSEWVPIKVPKIVDEETFRITQQQLKAHGGGKRYRVYLLSGLLRCASCGSRYIGCSADHNRYCYYRCGNPEKTFPLPRRCFAGTVRAERVEQAVVEAIRDAVSSPEVLAKHVIDLAKPAGDRMRNSRGRLLRLARQRNILEENQRRLLDLYVDGSISKDEYTGKKEDIEARKQGLSHEIEELDKEVPEIDEAEISRNVDYFCGLARYRLDAHPPEQTRQFLRLLIQEVVFDRNAMQAKIVGHLPSDA